MEQLFISSNAVIIFMEQLCINSNAVIIFMEQLCMKLTYIMCSHHNEILLKLSVKNKTTIDCQDTI
jgi:hypothetical protein